jgi:hypothetical protein
MTCLFDRVKRIQQADQQKNVIFLKDLGKNWLTETPPPVY